MVRIYNDAGISGAKGRAYRPGLDLLLKDASRRKFDVVMAWAIDRLGRSLIDLLGTIQHLEAVGVDLDQQAIDTTTPMGIQFLHRLRGSASADGSGGGNAPTARTNPSFGRRGRARGPSSSISSSAPHPEALRAAA